MNALLAFLQNADAVAFVLLGIATAFSWLRGREASRGYLAIAIILLSAVVGLGRLQKLLPFTIPLVSEVSLLAFAGSAFALHAYRNALIPLRRRWLVGCGVVLAAASGLVLLVESAGVRRDVATGVAIGFIVIWCLCVGEPIGRFWLVSRDLAAVQAWRLRSLTLGFGGLVALFVFAIGASLLTREPAVQVVIDLIVIGIVPLLYASFSPPAWLRREWRASEEEGLRRFMEELLIADDRDALAGRALDWAMRLVGGESVALFDAGHKPVSARGLTSAELNELAAQLADVRHVGNEIALKGRTHRALLLGVSGLSGPGTLVVLAGPFTPTFGADEARRVQQLMSAFITALDRRHLIVQLQLANHALRDANRHKSVFLANMSHELRTPLNAIIGFSELLTEAADGQFDERTRRRFVEQILSSGRHLLGLINDILDLSKVEAGQMELRLQTVSIAETVAQVVTTVESLVRKKGITLEAETAGAGDVLADAGKLKQMLLNLVSNAIKFTDEAGKVTIGVRRTETQVEISVADTGIGIAEEDQKQIFREFHQLDQGPGRKHEGTGLGLALTKRFAVMHGGDVRVSSRPNEGSVFTLTLPLRPASRANVTPNGLGGGTGPLILVAEDDAAAAELLTRQLSSAGYRVELAHSGTEAIAKARDLHPDAITLDIILPEIDGWGVITRLKSDEATSSIPIVVVSVVDNPELGIALGAIDYFVKPVDAGRLVQRLNELAGQIERKHDTLRVLVVDDEPANRNWLKAVLEPAGFSVIPASGGREGIELARSRAPDLVVLDLIMPDVTGFDVIEALRSDPSTRETPIMVVTAAQLTEADRKLLNGRVSQVLKRGSVGSSEILRLLRRVVVHRNGHT